MTTAPVLAPMLADEPADWRRLSQAAHDEALAARIVRYVMDADWALERKMDGHRAFVEVDGGVPTVIGKNGQASQHTARLRTPPYLAEFARFPNQRAEVLDCELVGGVLWVFDLVGDASRPANTPAPADQPLRLRRLDLSILFDVWTPLPDLFRLVPQATTTKAKADLARRCVDERWEGLVAKRLGSSYRPGRRCDDWIKLKPVHESDLVVMAVGFEERDNVVLGAYDGDTLVEVGHASTHGKGEIGVDDVVVVRFARYTDGGRLLFPRIQGRRTDKAAGDCTIDQLVPGTRTVTRP